MVESPTTPRRPASTRTRPIRDRSAGTFRLDNTTPSSTTSQPPDKRRKYTPGGPGGGGRYIDDNGNEVPVGGTGPGGYNYIGDKGRIGRQNAANGLVPVVYKTRDRSSRTRTVLPRSQQPTMRFTSAAQAAAVVQIDGYKPREERAWEEFHPDMDIEASLRAFSSDDIEGISSRPVTPVGASRTVDGSVIGASGRLTPNGLENSKFKSEAAVTPAGSLNGDSILTFSIPGTPGGGKRRPGRPPKDPVAFFAARAAKLGKGLNIGTPKAPKLAPPIVQNINAKEKLTLPQPSYRKTDTLARFDDKALGLVRYVDKAMANVGYQESDMYIRPEPRLIKVSDANLDEDLDLGPGYKSDGDTIVAIGSGGVGRVEYDMDEQDDKWLQDYNAERKAGSFDAITREVFEITITKIEKEWHALEKRIPKPNPKPPQTHRPRSSSAAAVNGEPQAGEEQDSKCAICDDGDCENTNAIVFCDGCDLAVHQECYGVPFIPEGQWLCRKCQLIGRGIPTCIFCPNTDGAFKQTNASKWAHLLCAMWIPEVSLGNHTFMEPVMEVEKVPKTRWKLTCYLCNQKMGACIQCGNKACYQAFHVTCARRARLFLKMKNSQGTLAVLDGTTVLKAFCDKHCPSDYSKENDVARATREARIFYRKTMRGRLWADSQASALAMAATHRHAVTEHQPDESQLTGAKVAMAIGDKKKGSQPVKAIWKLPSGAPVIPQVIYNSIESSIGRFNIRKRKEYAADACRYWTLKREARRGAALLKRLQLQMETFSSMEITRRNFAGMGHAGRPRLARRIEFAQTLIEDLERLKSLSDNIVKREAEKMAAVELEYDLVDSVYFPVAKLLPPVIEKALVLDSKGVFNEGLIKLRSSVDKRLYATVLPFARDLGSVINAGILSDPSLVLAPKEPINMSSPKKQIHDVKSRKALARRILKVAQSQLEAAIRIEAEISNKSADDALRDLEELMEASLQSRQDSASKGEAISASLGDSREDTEMVDAVEENGAKLINEGCEANQPSEVSLEQPNGAEDANVEMHDDDAPHELEDVDLVTVVATAELEVAEDTIVAEPLIPLAEVNGNISPSKFLINGIKHTSTPPDSNGYVTARESQQPAPPTPPTPPVSNGDQAPDSADLNTGGVLWYLREFEPVGTSLVDPLASRMSEDLEELSDMDDEELDLLGGDVNEANAQIAQAAENASANAAKAKKAKAKRRARANRW